MKRVTRFAEVAAALRALADAVANLDVGSSPESMVPLTAAAEYAATSPRVLRDAIRVGDLTSYGRQRDRTVRRADLDAWIASRKHKPIMGPDDPDIVRRMRRLEAAYREKLKARVSR